MAKMNSLSQAVDALTEAMHEEDDWNLVWLVCEKVAEEWGVGQTALYDAYRERMVGV